MSHYLFTSESVGMGHPDKLCDQVSDAIVDACLAQDPHAKVACETVVTSKLVLLAGEITTRAKLSYPDIVRQTIKEIGYDDPALGFDCFSCDVIVAFNEQSADIARGVHDEETLLNPQGAGDQGIMFGFACDETPELMPLPISVAHDLVRELNKRRVEKSLEYLRPDAKTQVTVEYDAQHRPVRIHTVVLSTQHVKEVSQEQIHADMKKMICEVAPKGMIDDATLFYINPTGRFVIGGPKGDCGLTGRKIMVDTYGGMARHGGGAFSGKDATKVDRAASYAARYVAKNLVAAKLASRCEVQFSYAIGIAHPLSIYVNTFGTGKVEESILSRIIPEVFDLSAGGMIEMLQLRRPIYQKSAFGGHFGRKEPEFTWEATDRVAQLLENVYSKI